MNSKIAAATVAYTLLLTAPVFAGEKYSDVFFYDKKNPDFNCAQAANAVAYASESRFEYENPEAFYIAMLERYLLNGIDDYLEKTYRRYIAFAAFQPAGSDDKANTIPLYELSYQYCVEMSD